MLFWIALPELKPSLSRGVQERRLDGTTELITELRQRGGGAMIGSMTMIADSTGVHVLGVLLIRCNGRFEKDFRKLSHRWTARKGRALHGVKSMSSAKPTKSK